MAVAEELVALLGFKVKGDGELKRWQRGITDAEKQARKTGSAIGRVGEAASGAYVGVGKLGAAIGIAGAGAFAKQALVGYATFERQMSRIGITAGASVKDTSAAGDALMSLASKYAMPFDQAREGLDALVSSGMSLKQSMSFLPSVMQAATASGATTQDIANSAQTLSAAFKITGGEMNDAFDIMIAGGKAGKFELKDMAKYIPDLANRFSALGYTGTDGLKSLIAMLQTLRERTGSAELANVQAQNLFSKVYSDKTIKNFKEKGIDLRKELEKSQKSGEDFFVAFGRLINKAVGGDFRKINDLFDDQELQGAGTTLGKAGDSLKRFLAILNSADVKGSGLNDAKRIVEDTASSLQKLENSWTRFYTSVGKAIAPTAVPLMDAASTALDDNGKADAIRIRKKGSLLNWYASGGSWMNDQVIAEDEAERRAAGAAGDDRRRKGMLNRPARRGGRLPPIAASGVSADRISGAFDPFPKPAAGVSAGSREAAVGFLRAGMAVPPPDTSAFMSAMDGVHSVLRDFSAGATAVLNVDTSAALAKIQDLRRAMQGVSGGASGSWSGTGTPARVGGAGSAQ